RADIACSGRRHAHARSVAGSLGTVQIGFVGPVGAFAPERVVVDGGTAGEIDELRDRQAARSWAPAELDVFGELFGEGLHDAVDHELFLDGEVAAVAVGDAPQPVTDRAQVIVAPSADFKLFEVVGDLARAKLAWRALPAGLDRQ